MLCTTDCMWRIVVLHRLVGTIRPNQNKCGHKLLGITTNCLTLIDTFCMATAGASHLTKFHRIGANERIEVII